MGCEIKTKIVKGEKLYQIRSTNSNELYHTKKWVTLDEAKKCMIESKFWRFFQDIVEIEKTFPIGYSVDGIVQHPAKGEKMFAEFVLKTYFAKNGAQKLDADFQEILKKHDIQLQDPNIDKHYSNIERLIINWNNDGTKTAGDLTRQIISLLENKK